MKIAITVCRPANPDALYNWTADPGITYKTHLVELNDLPEEVISAAREEKAAGCITNISFVEENTDTTEKK